MERGIYIFINQKAIFKWPLDYIFNCCLNQGEFQKIWFKNLFNSSLNRYQNKWSSGTVAMRKELEEHFISENSQFKELSTREIEHLSTRSSIPYRDPTGRGRSKEIISTREIEQSKSQLINTSSWRKRWNTAQ